MITLQSNPVSLLGQADVILLLADFLRSPSQISAGSLYVDETELQLLIESAELGEDSELVAAVCRAAELARQINAQEWSDEYHRLFEGAMVVPLNETAYIRRDKGAIIGDVAGFYKAFGWQTTHAAGEKQDHLLTELEFIAMLLVMSARAISSRNNEHVEVTAKALDLFAGAHLGDWLPSVCARLEQLTRMEFLFASARAIAQVWQALVARHGWTITPAQPLAPHAEPEEPYECGAETPMTQLNVK